MKISPISLKNYTSISTKQSSQSTQNYTVSSDSVSFSRSLNIIDNQYDELMEKVNKQIKPFYDSHADIYKAVGGIGLKLQAVNNLYEEKESDFLLYKAIKTNPQTALYCGDLKPIVSCNNKFQDNVRRYQDLIKLSKFDMYENDDLSFLIKSKRGLFDERNFDIKNLKPFMAFLSQNENELNNSLMRVTLQNAEPKLYDKLDYVKQNLFEAITVMHAAQYGEIKKVLDNVKEIETLKSDPKYSRFELSKRLEKENKAVDSILDNIDALKKMRHHISEFVAKIPEIESLMPTKADIEDAYSDLKSDVNLRLSKLSKDLVRFYDANYKEKGVKIDYQTLKRTFVKQENALDEIDRAMTQVREQYISQQNEWLND